MDRRRPSPLTLVTVTAAYVAAGKLGLALAFVHASASAVWPPAGIAMAALLLAGRGVWPAIFAGAFLVNVSNPTAQLVHNLGSPMVVLASLGIAAGNTLEGAAGAWLIERFGKGAARSFDTAAGVISFSALGGLASTLISATIGVATLGLTGFVSRGQAPGVWLTWWCGDATGALVVAPVLLLWVHDRTKPRTPAIEVLLFWLVLFAIGGAAFAGFLRAGVLISTLAFLCVPLLVWSALRLGRRDTSIALMLLSGLAVWGTLNGFGPFARGSENESLLLLQTFMAIHGMMALCLAAVVDERHHAHEQLHRARADLEARVAERTAELTKVNKDLKDQIAGKKRSDASLRASEARLRRSEEQYRLMFEANPFPLWVIDQETRRFLAVNPAAIAHYGWTREEFLALSENDVAAGEATHRKKDGTLIDVEVTRHQIAFDDKRAWLCLGHDVTERVRTQGERDRLLVDLEQRVKERTAELRSANESLKESLAEKEVLLKEIHHRVKNNLQVISSLLRLQAEEISDERTAALFYESQARVQSMALIHEQLYRAGNLAHVDFAAYLRHLAPHLARSYQANDKPVALSVEAATVTLPVDSAIPCGLIVNELITNALKHAFPGRNGKIVVELGVEDGRTRLVVRDDGIGFPANLDFRQTRSLGLQLVCALTTQVGGTIQLKRESGTEFEVSFRTA